MHTPCQVLLAQSAWFSRMEKCASVSFLHTMFFFFPLTNHGISVW